MKKKTSKNSSIVRCVGVFEYIRQISSAFLTFSSRNKNAFVGQQYLS